MVLPGSTITQHSLSPDLSSAPPTFNHCINNHHYKSTHFSLPPCMDDDSKLGYLLPVLQQQMFLFPSMISCDSLMFSSVSIYSSQYSPVPPNSLQLLESIDLHTSKCVLRHQYLSFSFRKPGKEKIIMLFTYHILQKSHYLHFLPVYHHFSSVQ